MNSKHEADKSAARSAWPETIANDDLSPSMVPGSGLAGEMDFDYFALTYPGYDLHGDACGAKANATSVRFREAGELPSDIDELRNAIFFEQRRLRHWGCGPDKEHATYLAALCSKLRAQLESARAAAPTSARTLSPPAAGGSG